MRLVKANCIGPFFHTWGPWGPPFKADAPLWANSLYHARQERVCLLCGRRSSRSVGPWASCLASYRTAEGRKIPGDGE